MPAATQNFSTTLEGVEAHPAGAPTHLDPPTNPGIDLESRSRSQATL
ncbi:MAG: hypothetical protein OXI26_09740 [bacterium]|nr:hypothetical protein [bacterium]